MARRTGRRPSPRPAKRKKPHERRPRIALSIRRFLAYRPEFRFHKVAMFSAAFVAVCGFSHLFSAVSLWWPAYGAQAIIKVSVALISLSAAILIWRIVPHLGSYPTPGEIAEGRETELRLREREGELSDALDRLRNADTAKANFFAAMSHDLRTPLNAIIGFSEALKLEIFGKLANLKQSEYIDHINSSSQQLLTLINDLLDLSGIESGSGPVKAEEIAVRPMLEEVVRQFEVSSISQSRPVRINLICNTDVIFADRTSLRRMLNNLLANSAKYGGRVRPSRSSRTRVEKASN